MADGPEWPLAAEQRLLLAGAARLQAPVYTISYGYRVTGDLDVGRLAAATHRLAAEVPLLRAVFTGSRVLPSGMRVLPEREVFVDHGEVADAATAYAHPVIDSPDTRRGEGRKAIPNAVTSAATTAAISEGHSNTCATAAPTVAALASTRPRKTTRRRIR